MDWHWSVDQNSEDKARLCTLEGFIRHSGSLYQAKPRMSLTDTTANGHSHSIVGHGKLLSWRVVAQIENMKLL
jgi:hypothetical protein